MNDQTAIPRLDPVRLAPETWLIPNAVPAGPDIHVPMNSMLIRGAQPVVVDTGAPLHRDGWFDQVFSLVEPEDVRWVFVSHDDVDHVGNLHELLERCPNATLVATFFLTIRQEVDRPLPVQRMVWLEAGATLDAGDRRLGLVLPPLFDGATTRALYDEKSRVLWAVDSFAAQTPPGATYASDVPADLYEASFRLLNSIGAPWHQWLDPVRYGRHLASLEQLGADVVASAHGPVLTGTAVPEAFDRVRALAGEGVVDAPGADVLHALVASAAEAA